MKIHERSPSRRTNEDSAASHDSDDDDMPEVQQELQTTMAALVERMIAAEMEDFELVY